MVENLIPNDPDHVEGLLGGNRVDEDVAMNTDEMLRVQDAILILVFPLESAAQLRYDRGDNVARETERPSDLPRSINDFGGEVLSFVFD